MNCSLSGEVPREPVVSKKSGHIFEKRLIEKHLASSSTCPVTGTELAMEDLIPVKANRKIVSPRDVTATSVPGMLSLFQKEWDALMLEQFVLKQNVHKLRQELSQTLYQHDAACRVIARLIKERDQAIAAYQDSQARAGPATSTNASTSNPNKDSIVPNGVLQVMQAKADALKPGRKKRNKPSTLSSKEQMKGMKISSEHTPHGSTRGGITCVDIHTKHSNFIVSGGVDKNIKIFDSDAKKVRGTGKGHNKKVTSIVWHPTQAVFFSGSDDKTVRAWSAEDNSYVEKARFSAHVDGVTGVAAHITGNFIASSSLDGTWKLHDCVSAQTITSANGSDKGISSLAFHPDGLLMATGGQQGAVAIWDMKSASTAQKILEGHTQSVASLAFSENGYMMASGSDDGTVRLWDLRKLKCVKDLELPTKVHSVRFDHTGTYLACGSADTRVLHVKSWSQLALFSENESDVLGVSLTNDARGLATVSSDRKLRLYTVE
jgi:pre-mRNA-processing factor 19